MRGSGAKLAERMMGRGGGVSPGMRLGIGEVGGFGGSGGGSMSPFACGMECRKRSSNGDVIGVAKRLRIYCAQSCHPYIVQPSDFVMR